MVALPFVPFPAHAAEPPAPVLVGPLLHPLFSDGAVLQRDRRIPIWGFARPGEKIQLSLDGGKIKTSASTDKSGKWSALIGPMGAGTGHTLEVLGPNPTQRETRTNLAFGDVWLCSGQSNMQFQIGGANNAEAEIRAANFPGIRFFHVPQSTAVRPRELVDAKWQSVSPATVNGFSAVGYFFGRELHQKLNVPIGLIDSSWGGTTAEVWASGTALKAMPDFKTGVEAVEQTRADVPFDEQMKEWMNRNDTGLRAGWNTPVFDDSPWTSAKVPGPFTRDSKGDLTGFDGFVWYRTELNVPEAMAGRDATLSLGKIDDDDVTYWNGVEVGSARGYDTIRRYKIPAAQMKAGRSTLAIRVFDAQFPGGLMGTGAPNGMKLESGGIEIPLEGAWKIARAASTAELGQSPAPVPEGVGVYPNAPSTAFNAMIAPLVPFGIKGALWYQGESNAGRAEQYKPLLTTLITDWRARFGSGDFPFYIVQLAGFQAPDAQPSNAPSWAQVRESQAIVAANIKNSGYAVATDIGEQRDIHPRNKQDVGKRLALLALKNDYGQNVESSGPTVRNVEIEGEAVRLRLDHIAGGLKLQGETNNVFALAGSDKKWAWATVAVEGDSLVLRSPEVKNPVAVRFAWSNFPRGNVYNGAGLPMAPFRSDKW